MKWENMGDINFVAYGGCLVRPHFENPTEENKYVYDVFYLNPEVGNENQNYAALCCIDLTDSWLDYDGMLYACGLDEYMGKSFEELVKLIDPTVLAEEMVVFHGVTNFNPSVNKKNEYLQYPSEFEDFIVTDEELNQWLKDIGAEEYCIEEGLDR